MNVTRSIVAAAVVTFTLAGALSPALRAADSAAGQASAAPAQKVDINKATVEQLQILKGIGPSLARRIVEYREKEGPFQRIEEIMNVRGIGEKTFLRFKDRITVGEPAAREN